jgi:phage anti-repressor protein
MKKNETNLKVLESSIVPVYEGKSIDEACQTEQLVNARELWEFLKIETRFDTWINRRIEEYSFKAGEDFCTFLSKSTGGRPATEYMFKLDVAKELAMVENNDNGRMVRRYFIEAEKRFREEKLARARIKAERRVFTDVIKELVPDGPHKVWAYKNLTDIIYKVVTGKNAVQLRVQYGLAKKESVTPYLSLQEQKEVVTYERIVESLLELGKDYKDVKTILENPNLLSPAKAV